LPSPLINSALQVGLETLRANPMRSLLSTLGIIMGVGALVSVLSLGDGMANFARDQIDQTTDLQAISVTPVMFRTVDGQRFPRNDVVIFTPGDADSLAAFVGAGASVRVFVTGQALVTTRRDTTPRAALVIGGYQRAPRELPPMTAGRFLTDEELVGDAPVVVISKTLAGSLDKSRSAQSFVGDTLLFQGQPRVVIGMTDAQPGRGAEAIMSLAAARGAMPPALVGRPTTLLVKAARVEDVAAAAGSIERWLAARHGPSWKDRVSVASNESRVAQAAQGLLVFKLFMGAITGISLLVGGVGIMNVLLASVTERTREIGIRKAAGATHRQIFLQFLTESVTISAVGSLIGIILGVGAAAAGTGIMRSMSSAPVHAGFSASTFLVAVLASVFVGIVFGLYPAMRAARLSPIDAIRHE
jgi:putative ABC transport system permease protein